MASFFTCIDHSSSAAAFGTSSARKRIAQRVIFVFALILSVVALALATVVAVVYIVGLSEDGGDVQSWLSLAGAVLVASSAVWLRTQIVRAKRTRK